MSVTLIVCAVGWALGWLLMGRGRRVGDENAPEGVVPAYTVVIPARDEAASLPNLLRGLRTGETGAPRVIVVDDHSEDGTAHLAAGFPGVEVVPAPPLPHGWTGKSWACHTGALMVDTDMVAFLDADVRADRAALDRVVAHGARSGGLVSVQPWHETERSYEQLSAMFNVVAVMGTAMGSRRGTTGAFGPVVVSAMADYRAVGGHEAVAPEVVEDLALARCYREHGFPVEILAGGRQVRFRMYPGGLRQLVEGWTKNVATGAGSTRPVRLTGVVWWITALGTAALALLDAVTRDIPVVVGTGLYLAFAAQLSVMFARVGRFGPATALVYPVPLLVFLAVFLRSLWRTLVRHSVTWRGRLVPTRG